MTGHPELVEGCTDCYKTINKGRAKSFALPSVLLPVVAAILYFCL